jgi:heat shock protein HslJ
VTPRRLVAVAIIGLTLVGCADATDSAGTGGDLTSLEGTTWILDRDSATALGDDPGDARATIRFEAGEVSGQAFCNHFGGDYTSDGEAMTIAVGAMTEMACEEPLMMLEQAFVAALGEVTGVGVDGDRMTLSGGEVSLGFDAEQPRALIGTDWRLDGLASGGAVTSTIAGTEATLTLAADGQATGNGGCNSYGGGFETEGTDLRFEDLHSTMMACLEPEGLMDQEAAFLAALGETRAYEIQGSTLSLFGEDGGLLATLVAAD